jgi:hypothetical protein
MTMTAPTPPLELAKPLPAELLRRTSSGITAYQSYPVFSWTWLRKRTLLVLIILGVLGALSLIGMLVSTGSLLSAGVAAASLIAGGLVLTTGGPALAMAARHGDFPRRHEQRLVVAALVIGTVASYFTDGFLSYQIEVQLGLPAPAQPARPAAPVAQAVTFALSLCLYGLLGGGLALRRYFQEPGLLAVLARERELAELRARHRELDTHMALLQAQIEPHFLFNTLASVRSLVVSDPAAASATIDALVDYLRATIPRIREASAETTLGQQLEICEAYLKVMAVRMGRLDYRIEATPELRALRFPPLLLVSLVENAVKHGIEPRRGAGHVTIRASMQQRALIVSVADDGVGLSAQPGNGVGLHNVREQLRARYGARARLTLASQPPAGATATITIDEPAAGLAPGATERKDP